MKLTHINEQGRAHMVEVGDKENTNRAATAHAMVRMQKQTLTRIQASDIKKGDVLAVAQVAGIMAVKQTANVIPMAHPLAITSADIWFEIEGDTLLHVYCSARVHGKTGIEMEVLHGVSIAALTIYDMVKAIDQTMTIEQIYLLEKSGGKTGVFKREVKQ